ncbi:MAG: hypothetical protein IIC60_09840 [Proteobacteria bacterium]|nr:hypothetical protein [Pseudomonadota bacterium]
MQRFRLLTMVVVLGATFGAQSWRPLQAQDAADCRTPRAVCDGFDRFRLNLSNSPTWSPQMIRDSGRPFRARRRSFRSGSVASLATAVTTLSLSS